ncbi:MAG: hypothetical protein HZC24_10940 [Rhodocyclales bacterium]|nr:hypothetical protein [Rhodocyclales bacterium]
MNAADHDVNSNTDALQDFVGRVTGLHEKVAQIASKQRAMCPVLQRTADALRELAQATRQ